MSFGRVNATNTRILGGAVETQIEVDDAVVLLLGTTAGGSPAGHIAGITRLEKLVFLLQKEEPTSALLDEDPDFRAHNFGPFSKKVYQAVDMLAAAELITDSRRNSSTDDDTWEQRELVYDGDGTLEDNEAAKYVSRSFSLTQRGWRYFRSLEGDLDKSQSKAIANLKSRFGSLSLRELIRYVYLQYPEFATNSVIADRVYREAERDGHQPVGPR